MIFERLSLGIYGANCYILGCKKTKETIVIDPGGNVDLIFNKLKENNLKIKYIVLTHGHGDHIGGLIELKNSTEAEVLIHKDDEDMLLDADINLSNRMNMEEIEIKPDKLLKDGDIITFGKIEGVVIHTPGHTKGSICIRIDDKLITGDTLFKDSIGRSDLYGGNHRTLIHSIKDKLFLLDDKTKVYPGHGNESTIGYEKMNNPYIYF